MQDDMVAQVNFSKGRENLEAKATQERQSLIWRCIRDCYCSGVEIIVTLFWSRGSREWAHFVDGYFPTIFIVNWPRATWLPDNSGDVGGDGPERESRRLGFRLPSALVIAFENWRVAGLAGQVSDVRLPYRQYDLHWTEGEVVEQNNPTTWTLDPRLE